MVHPLVCKDIPLDPNAPFSPRSNIFFPMFV